MSIEKNAQPGSYEFLSGAKWAQETASHDRSEKLLQRGGGRAVSIYVILVKAVHTMKHVFLQNITASHGLPRWR